MKRLIQLNLLLLLISTATAQESRPTPQQTTKVLRAYDWNDLVQQHQLSGGEVISIDGMSVLKIENTNDAPQDIILLKISDASVIKKANILYGEIKHESVSGNSTVMLMSRFPPDASGGDEINVRQNGAFLNGTSNWRPYQFRVTSNSFNRNGLNRMQLPTQLEIHLYLAGPGTVYLRPIKLLGFIGSWWLPQQIGLIGGIGGSVIGFFGALLGLLASKGKARNFVLTTMKIFIALGILLTIAGFVAVVSSQPYAVWYALLLPGVILTLVFSLNLPSIQRRYDELEIRRMISVDAMGS